MNRILITIGILYATLLANAQSGFNLEIVPYDIHELPPIHANAFAQYDGKWLIIGGRTGELDQPSYLNYDLMVIDPVSEDYWVYPLEWTDMVMENPDHLGNCYAAHFQEGSYLFLAGGMGYSMESEAFGPFPTMTIVDVPKTINAIIHQEKMKECFFQLENEGFKKQDALLTKIADRFYLAGGRQFFGDFDEQGELSIEFNTTNEVFSFLLEKNDSIWTLSSEKMIDYKDDFETAIASYVPQVFPDGKTGISIFLNNPDGYSKNLEWMNIFNFGYSTYVDSSRNIANYHSTIIPVYDAETKRMHSIFIGGCDEYFCSIGENYAPDKIDYYESFVRDENGKVTVTRSQMDAYLAKGRDAQFILNQNIPQYPNKVIDLEKITDDRQLLGYIYGGATTPGMMLSNDGSVLDTPSNQLFKVYITKTNKKENLGWQPVESKKDKYRIYIPLK